MGLAGFKLHGLRREGGGSLNDHQSTGVRKGNRNAAEANITLCKGPSIICL